MPQYKVYFMVWFLRFSLPSLLVFLSHGSRAQTDEDDSSGFYKLEGGVGAKRLDPGTEEVLKFLQIAPPENTDSSSDSPNSIPKLLSYYKRTVYPDKLDQGVAAALENHIEEMEPKFSSASFRQLWQALRDPLTQLFRPKRSQVLLEELARCVFGNMTEASHYNLPTLVVNIRRDLVICKIGDILKGGDHENTQTTFPKRDAFRQLWKLLRNAIAPVFRADLRTLITEIAHYSPRFELAGISYSLPGKMPDIQRDVAICKVDDVFNELYDNNFQRSRYLPSQKEPEYFP